MTEAAHVQMAGGDGMRYLGADPSRPADEIERAVARSLTRRVHAEHERMSAHV